MAAYEILRTLDRGGMAEVFLARLVGVEGFEKRVVLKRVLPHLSRDRRFVERFLDEARLAAGLSHPNLVQIFELGQQHGQLFIAMEHIDGRNLRDVEKRLALRGERMPLEHALRIVCFLCEALHYAHGLTDARGTPLHLVHRDVSPSNVLVSFDGAVKLIDFGIAKTEAHVERTRPGAVLGKCGYMSPEQARGEPLDGRSDLFSCGSILYALVTGRQPFPGADDLAVMTAIARGHLIDPRDASPELDEALAAILRRALAHRREDRFPRALDLQLALEGYLASRGLVSNTALLGEYLRRVFNSDRGPGQRPASEPRTESQIVTLLPTAPSQAEASTIAPPPRADAPIADAPFPDEGTLTLLDAPPATDAASRHDAIVQPLSRTGRPARRPSSALFAIAGSLLVAGGFITTRLLWPSGVASPSALQAVEPAPSPPVELEHAPPPAPIAEDLPTPVLAIATPSGPREEPRSPPAPKRDVEKPRDHTRDRPARARSRKIAKPPAPPRKPGALTLDSEPWSEVFLGDKRIGMTPLASYPLPAGRHRLTLVNPQAGLRRQIAVEIQPGRTARMRVRLDDR